MLSGIALPAGSRSTLPPLKNVLPFVGHSGTQAARLGRSGGSGQRWEFYASLVPTAPCEYRRMRRLHYLRFARDLSRERDHARPSSHACLAATIGHVNLQSNELQLWLSFEKRHGNSESRPNKSRKRGSERKRSNTGSTARYAIHTARPS
jgi:hypothetical protein